MDGSCQGSSLPSTTPPRTGACKATTGTFASGWIPYSELTARQHPPHGMQLASILDTRGLRPSPKKVHLAVLPGQAITPMPGDTRVCDWKTRSSKLLAPPPTDGWKNSRGISLSFVNHPKKVSGPPRLTLLSGILWSRLSLFLVLPTANQVHLVTMGTLKMVACVTHRNATHIRSAAACRPKRHALRASHRIQPKRHHGHHLSLQFTTTASGYPHDNMSTRACSLIA